MVLRQVSLQSMPQAPQTCACIVDEYARAFRAFKRCWEAFRGVWKCVTRVREYCAAQGCGLSAYLMPPDRLCMIETTVGLYVDVDCWGTSVWWCCGCSVRGTSVWCDQANPHGLAGRSCDSKQLHIRHYLEHTTVSTGPELPLLAHGRAADHGQHSSHLFEQLVHTAKASKG